MLTRHNLTPDGKHYLEPITDQEDNVVGYIETHPSKLDTSKSCSGSVRIEGAKWTSGPSWVQEGTWPNITLTPSILCRICGMHGYVRSGVWLDC